MSEFARRRTRNRLDCRSPDPARVELTDGAIIDDAPSNVRTLRALKDLGLMLSIDDSGTGGSSLSFPFSEPIAAEAFTQLLAAAAAQPTAAG